MTTQELIMQLSTFHPETDVWLTDNDGLMYEVDNVYESFGGATIMLRVAEESR